MLLTGTFVRSVDEKLRVAIPKPLRDILVKDGDEWVYVAPGTDGSLSLYAPAAFAELAHRFAELSSTEKDVRAHARLFFAQAQAVELDRQGRLRVPPELARLADFGREIVVIGVQDHIELWDQPRWNTYLSEKQQRYDEIAEAAFRDRKR